MNKKIVIAILIALFISFSVIAYIIIRQQKTSFHSPLSSEKIKPPTQKKEEWIIYSNPSGFTFQYPKGYVISDRTKENKQAYSDLVIQKSGITGKISLTITDSLFTSLEEWKKQNKINISEDKIKNIKLADIEAKQFSIINGLQTIAFDKQTLISIILDAKNKQILIPIYNKLIDSFEFIQPEQTSDNTVTSESEDSGEVIFEGEEVIE